MLVGPSGCGKTTTLKMINRLIEPSSGKHADRRRRSPAARTPTSCAGGIGYVIQGGSLFPHLTVAANIAMVPKMLGWDRARIAARVDELLDLVGLDPGRTATATRASCPAASSSGSGWPAAWPPTRPSS